MVVFQCEFFSLSYIALDTDLTEAPDIDEDVELIDEATRKFNFWTHQIHIFFVRKFFPMAEKYVERKKKLEMKRVEDARQRIALGISVN